MCGGGIPPRTNGKLGVGWTGPYKVVSRPTECHAIIQLTPEGATRRVHINQLKPHLGWKPTQWQGVGDDHHESNCQLPGSDRNRRDDEPRENSPRDQHTNHDTTSSGHSYHKTSEHDQNDSDSDSEASDEESLPRASAPRSREPRTVETGSSAPKEREAIATRARVDNHGDNEPRAAPDPIPSLRRSKRAPKPRKLWDV